MHVVAALNRKGGPGKSSFCLSVGALLYSLGYRVLMLDLDAQHSLVCWRQWRTRSGPDVVAALPADAPALIRQSWGRYDIILVDTPGTDSPEITRLYGLLDLAVLVTRPSVLDAACANGVLTTLLELDVPTAVCLTQVPPGMTARVMRWIDLYGDGGRLIRAHQTYRLAVQDATAAGLGISEYTPNGPGAEEVRQIWAEIATRLGVNHA